MALDKVDASKAARHALELMQNERTTRLDKIDKYVRGEQDPPYMPKESGPEYKTLAERSITNMLGIAINTRVQGLLVEGYRRARSPENSRAWQYWLANRMPGRQVAIHAAMLQYGISYTTVLPGLVGDRSVPVMRGVSPRQMMALYEDQAEDEWPVAALRVSPTPDPISKLYRFRLLDDTQAHALTAKTRDGDGLEYLGAKEHKAGVCPVVRHVCDIDLEGRYQGEVERLWKVQDRINQTVFDLLMTQSFGSWKIRTVSGMVLPDDDEEARRKKLQVAQDRFLVAEDHNTKFGQLDETPLDPLLNAAEAAKADLALVGQVPPYYLLGKIANLAADALSAAESSSTRRNGVLTMTLGESHGQSLQLAARLAGDTDAAADFEAKVVWRDVESRSLSQLADALGKLATQLGIPPEALWDRIPGVTTTEIEAWKELAAQRRREDPMNRMADNLDRQGNPAGGGGGDS